jgi:GTPase SAR1 family protein
MSVKKVTNSIMVVGLENSGKTTMILTSLTDPNKPETFPTANF